MPFPGFLNKQKIREAISADKVTYRTKNFNFSAEMESRKIYFKNKIRWKNNSGISIFIILKLISDLF